MKMKDDSKRIITGIDIGTTKVCVIIAQWTEDKPLEILGVGKAKSTGLKKGIVVNISETVTAVNKAVNDAQKQAGIEVEAAFVGITGDHIRGFNNTGVITVSKNATRIPTDQQITELDKQRVLEHAQSITLPLDRRILHVLPQEFKVDDHGGIKDPESMSGHRLEAKVHLVTGAKNTEKNLASCLEKAGIDVISFVVDPLASSYSVCDPNEKKLGVALLDIGGGTTDVIVYFDDGVHHTGVIPFGGESITSDIAHGVQTTLEQAEKLKCQYGIAKEALASTESDISVQGIGGRQPQTISQKELASFIEPRMKEILLIALSEIRKSDHRGGFTFGIVLTGGGALLSNIEDLAQEIFHQPTKIGKPIIEMTGLTETILDPTYATALGLIQYAIEEYDDDYVENQWSDKLGTIGSRIRDFFKNLY
ncbi:MAG: cell division protein FtsA [FCB group bacterium]|nr:cell division protein FtsA [FCB group bacterium]